MGSPSEVNTLSQSSEYTVTEQYDVNTPIISPTEMYMISKQAMRCLFCKWPLSRIYTTNVLSH